MSRTVLITGSGRGIGEQTARLFWEKGDNVVLNARHPERIRQAAAEYNAFRPGSAIAVTADVCDHGQVEQLFEEAHRAFGRVDVLINNAAVANIGLFTDISILEWDTVFDTSVKGTFYCSQLAAREMVRRHEGGVILNVSSMWGQVGASCEVAYSSAKGAVIAFTKALAKELGPSGIRVNCVAPGVIDTDMNAMHSGETMRELAAETPLGRIGTADEVAQSVLYLCSERASFITGQVLGVTGGF